MASSAARLPIEIIEDILSRLPAKSIGQFRCVSRPWRALLCNPEFVQAHLIRHTHDQEKLLLVSTLRSLFTLTLSSATATATGSDGVLKQVNLSQCQDNWVSVVGSCNGLALVVNGGDSEYLINPTTCEHVKLSISPLAPDPSSSFRMHGFGYDSVNDDYKILVLSWYDTDIEHQPDHVDYFVDVYSAKRGSWRRLGTSPYDLADLAVLGNGSGVFVNGALHWLASCTSDYSSVIAAFNLADEVFEELPPPDSLDSDEFEFNKLVVLGGCLCMVDDQFGDRTDIWMMKEYGVANSWTKFSITSSEYVDEKHLCLFGDKKLVAMDGNNLKIKSLKEETSRDMVLDGTPAEFKDGVTFRESLVSPNFNSWDEQQRSSQGQD